MTDDTLLSDSLAHLGGGTVLVVTYLGVVIPGFFAVLALTVAVTALLILPFVVLGLAAAIAVAPPYGMWRLATRARRRRGRDAVAAPVQPAVAPSPHVC